MNKKIEQSIFLIGGGFLLFAIDLLMTTPAYKLITDDDSVVRKFPSESFGLILIYYIIRISALVMTFLGLLKLMAFFIKK